VRDIDIKGKVVLLRADYDVSIRRGKIADDSRIRASLPTLEYLVERGAKQVIILSHLGKPKGRDDAFSLIPVAVRLEKLLNQDVYLHDINSVLPTAKFVLMENLFLIKANKREA